MEENVFELDVVSIRLVKEVPILYDRKIDSPEVAVSALGKVLCEMDRECVCIINLMEDNTPINCHFVSIGTLNQSLVHPREMLKAAILSNAAKMLMIHNHPSGKKQPSIEDIKTTERMTKITELMGIPLVDHIIVGDNNNEYYSFKEKGQI